MSTAIQEVPIGTYEVDPIHSSVGYAIKAAGLTGFRSAFAAYDGRLQDGVLSGSAELASMQIAEEQLKATLLSPAFFDADQYPKVEFRSTDIRIVADGGVDLVGELSMHGVTAPVTATGTFESGQDPNGIDRVAFELTAEIDRRDFGVAWQSQMPNGLDAVGWTVKIDIQLQFVKQG
jgi:polyisoprenoid-binding protein YceI